MDEQELSIATITNALPDVLAVYRFGSHGTPDQRADSDIDLAVLGREPFDAVTVWNLAQELAIKLGRDVDLVDLSASSTVFQAQVLSTGERVWCGDVSYCDAYETHVFSAYAWLNEERREILADIAMRGSVYGG